MTSLNIEDMGTSTDGDCTDIIQEAVLSSKDVIIPCGEFLVSRAIYIPTGVSIRGHGYSSKIKATSDFQMESLPWAGGKLPIIFASEGVRSLTITRGIKISNIFFDSSLTGNGVHNIHMRNTQWVDITGCYFSGGADGTAFTLSKNYKVHGNNAWGQTNCCYDQWESSSQGIISNNIGYVTRGYGILATGDTSLNTVSTSSDITVINNTIIGPYNGNGSTGIWLQSGSNLSSNLYSSRVCNNSVAGFKVGIRATGGGSHIISENKITGCSDIGLSISAEVLGNASSSCIVTSNNISSSGKVGTGGIMVQSGASSNLFANNLIDCPQSDYAFMFDNTTSANILRDNLFKSGSLGFVFNANSSNNAVNSRTGN